MKLNEEKLTAMVEAVMKINECLFDILNREPFEKNIRTALTPFCMELTDEEIKEAIINECIFDPDYDHWATGDKEMVTNYFNRAVLQSTGIFIKPSTIMKLSAKFARDYGK